LWGQKGLHRAVQRAIIPWKGEGYEEKNAKVMLWKILTQKALESQKGGKQKKKKSDNEKRERKRGHADAWSGKAVEAYHTRLRERGPTKPHNIVKKVGKLL